MKEIKNKPKYPIIAQLGIPVHTNCIEHILSKELKKYLTKPQYKLFNEYFGAQTCPIVDGKQGLYPWDVEAVLHRIFKKELIGSQKYWD